MKWMIPGALLGFAVGVSMCALIRPAHSAPDPAAIQLAQVGELNDNNIGNADIIASQVIQQLQIERLQKNVKRLEDWQIGATLRLMNMQTEMEALQKTIAEQNLRMNRIHRFARAAIKAQAELRALKLRSKPTKAVVALKKGKTSHVKAYRCKCKAPAPARKRAYRNR